jgi:2,3-bisphosphoglycerate-independent phosphoglycerate mutase
MLDGGEPDTAHTCNPVPLIVTVAGITLESAGTLADVAPTVLSLLDIPQPAGMDGHKLLR